MTPAAIQTTLSLPTLRQGQGPPGAVGRLQHIFNDFAKADDDPRIFDESGVFGPKTNDAVREFPRTNGLQVDGIINANEHHPRAILGVAILDRHNVWKFDLTGLAP